MKKLLIIPFIFIVLVVTYVEVGFYTIQPLGALPQGITLIVWRHGDEPFFNSPDAMSLKKTGKVSLLSRGVALANGPADRIIVRLPYVRSFYLLSTNGQEFEK